MNPKHLTTIQRIVDLVCSSYHVTPEEIEGPSHNPRIVWPRYVCLLLSQQFTPLSRHELALIFNRRRNSIGVALRTAQGYLETSCSASRQVASLATDLSAVVPSFIIHPSPFPLP